jgi:hypothetical protein
MKDFHLRDWFWRRPVFLAAVVLTIDYLTGPLIQFPIVFILPVGVAAWFRGMKEAVFWSLFLPLWRFLFLAFWGWPWSWRIELPNSFIRLITLLGIAFLLSRLAEHRQEIRVLKVLLSICSFCKKIRDQDGQWIQLESYISGHSETLFSHCVCPDCMKQHYGGFVDLQKLKNH